uniref:Uncharacterized protein n=1 Tax=Nelumbo nucifera TaxID=4432 RepID=A0A822Y4H8_NELNU|nr:TPA_asm: hypothetical protein HUJ06_028815 [Nelumbo nucifera]
MVLAHSITDELHPDDADDIEDDDELLVVFRKPLFILFHSNLNMKTACPSSTPPSNNQL